VFILKNWYELQNLKLIIVDAQSNPIRFGTTTNKRPHFLLRLKIYAG